VILPSEMGISPCAIHCSGEGVALLFEGYGGVLLAVADRDVGGPFAVDVGSEGEAGECESSCENLLSISHLPVLRNVDELVGT